MTNNADMGFNSRLRRLEKQHRSLARGGVTSMRPDGLLVLRPRTFSVWRFLAPPVFVVVLGLTIKAVTLASIGEIAYRERVSKLVNGTMAEQYAAKVAQVDPISDWGADQIAVYAPKLWAALQSL